MLRKMSKNNIKNFGKSSLYFECVCFLINMPGTLSIGVFFISVTGTPSVHGFHNFHLSLTLNVQSS